MKERFLPIGTVVTLKEAKKSIMIVGYLPLKEGGKLYDYSACLFPEGILDPNQTLMFNHDKIETINHLGLEDKNYVNYNNFIREKFGYNKNVN